MRYLLLILIAVAMTFAVQSKNAAAGTIKDCDKIQAADAYNQCLASFGPIAHEHELKPVPAGIGSGRPYRAHHRYYAHSRHRRGGRKTIELSIGSGGGQD